MPPSPSRLRTRSAEGRPCILVLTNRNDVFLRPEGPSSVNVENGSTYAGGNFQTRQLGTPFSPPEQMKVSLLFASNLTLRAIHVVSFFLSASHPPEDRYRKPPFFQRIFFPLANPEGGMIFFVFPPLFCAFLPRASLCRRGVFWLADFTVMRLVPFFFWAKTDPFFLLWVSFGTRLL